MTDEKLTYSRKALFGFLFILVCLCLFSPCIALFPEEFIHQRRLGVFRLLGTDGLRLIGIVGTLMFLPMSVGVFRRLTGAAAAAVIRSDGVEINGLVLSRFVPWRALDRISVSGRMVNSKIIGLLKAQTNELDDAGLVQRFMFRQSKGISTQFLVDDIEQMVDWANKANAAKLAWAQSGNAPVSRGPAVQDQHAPVTFGRRRLEF